jgi:hypothetical protein
LPGTKILDYLALALLLAPAEKGGELFFKHEPILTTDFAEFTVFCIIVGGLLLACSRYWQNWRASGGRVEKIFRFLDNSLFGRAIIILFVMLVSSGVFLLTGGSSGAAPDFNSYVSFENVIDKHFYNERVILDGKSFEDCTFENATFVYNGTAPVHMKNIKILGTKIFASDNVGVASAAAILYGLGVLPPTTRLLNLPASSHIEPPHQGD